MELMTRQEIGRQLRRLREQTGLTQKQVSDILSRNQQSVNHWETGYSQPNIETLMRLLEIYGIDSVFTPNQRYQRNLNKEEMRLLTAFKKAPRPIREAARRLLQLDEEESRADRALGSRFLPVFDLPYSGQIQGAFLDGDNYELEEVGESVPVSATLGVRVHDDSMVPMVDMDQVVWVRRQKTLEHGDVGIFLLDGKVLVKRLWKQLDRVTLLSVNEAYAPIVIEDENKMRILGKVLS